MVRSLVLSNKAQNSCSDIVSENNNYYSLSKTSSAYVCVLSIDVAYIQWTQSILFTRAFRVIT